MADEPQDTWEADKVAPDRAEIVAAELAQRLMQPHADHEGIEKRPTPSK